MDPFQPMSQAAPPAAYPYYAPVNPIATPAKVFGIIHAVLAVLALVGSFSLGAIASLSGLRGANPAGMLFPILTAIVLISAVLNAATAYGLLARKSWGRTLLIVVSILSLISIPIGTILGGVALYFFMRNGAEQDYARLTLGQP